MLMYKHFSNKPMADRKLAHSSKQVVNQELEHNCQPLQTETFAPI